MVGGVLYVVVLGCDVVVGLVVFVLFCFGGVCVLEVVVGDWLWCVWVYCFVVVVVVLIEFCGCVC